MALRSPPGASSSLTRHDDSPPCADKPQFMYILELIFRLIVNLIKQAWLLPKTIALGLEQRRRQLVRRESEVERLDRIRNPAKYAGR